MAFKLITTNSNRCPVCGDPISQPGIHDRCKAPGQIKDCRRMHAALSGLLEETKARLAEAQVKRWHKGMGREELERLFPDMVDRVGL